MTRRPVHPGEILADELEALDLSSAEFAPTLDVPATRILQSLPESGRSPLIRPCALPGISDQVPISG
jgi:hypothetical protein